MFPVNNSSTNTNSAPVPEEAEWLFADCDAKQLPTCERYEYARQSMPMRAVIEDIRQLLNSKHPLIQSMDKITREVETQVYNSALSNSQMPMSKKEQEMIIRQLLNSKHPLIQSMDKTTREVETQVYNSVPSSSRMHTSKEEQEMIIYEELMSRAKLWFVEIAYFPNIPWLSLDANIREQYCIEQNVEKSWFEELQPQIINVEVIQTQVADDWKQWATSKSDFVCGWFAIPRGELTKDQVIEAFKTALNKLVKDDDDMLIRQASRGGPIDNLRKLGALRLMKDRPASQARNIYHFNKKSGSKEYLYSQSNEQPWYEARKAANALIAEVDHEAEILRGYLDEAKSVK